MTDPQLQLPVTQTAVTEKCPLSLCSHLKAGPWFWHESGDAAGQKPEPLCHQSSATRSVERCCCWESRGCSGCSTRHKQECPQPASPLGSGIGRNLFVFLKLYLFSAGINAYGPHSVGSCTISHPRVGGCGLLSLRCKHKVTLFIPVVSQACNIFFIFFFLFFPWCHGV